MKNVKDGRVYSRAKLTDENVHEIRGLSLIGVSRKTLAKKFNVTEMNIGHIVNRKSWRHL